MHCDLDVLKAACTLQPIGARHIKPFFCIWMCPFDCGRSYLLRCLRAAGMPDSSSLRTYFLVPMQ